MASLNSATLWMDQIIIMASFFDSKTTPLPPGTDPVD